MVHDNPDIFPEPGSFNPERWLEHADLDHWLVVFGKGPRSCIGLKYEDPMLLSPFSWEQRLTSHQRRVARTVPDTFQLLQPSGDESVPDGCGNDPVG